jgi:hypothetical protein
MTTTNNVNRPQTICKGRTSTTNPVVRRTEQGILTSCPYPNCGVNTVWGGFCTARKFTDLATAIFTHPTTDGGQG